MSGIPSRRHPFKSPHFHDIFRAPTTYHPTQPGPLFPTHDSPSELPELQDRATESPTKKRSSRLPLFGRSRKKSTHSDIAHGTPPRPSETQSGRGSTTTHTSRHEGSSLHARASTSQPSLLAVSTQPTLSSKIAAHFTPRKSRKHKSAPSLSQSEEVSDSPSHTSSPPVTTFRPSTESTQSRKGLTRQTGTPTLRRIQTGNLAQPTITVSQPDSDDLSEYDDLFTKPRQKAKGKPAPLQIPPLDQKPRDRLRDSSTSTISSPSSPDAPPDLGFSEGDTHSSATTPTPATPTPTGGLSRPSSAEVSTLPASVSIAADPVTEKRLRNDITTGENQSFKSSRGPSSSSRTKPIHSRVTPTATDTELYSTADESDAMSVMSMPALGSSSFARRRKSSNQTADNRLSPTLSYRLDRGRNITLAPSSKPPTRPLPPPPNTGGRPRATTLLPLSQSSNPGTSLRRHNSAWSKTSLSSPPTPPPKDDTVSSEAPQSSTNSNNHSSQSSSDSSSSSTQTLTKTNLPQIQPLDIQIDTASADELRLALRQRNMQLDNLANYLKNVTEIHAQEKAQLESQIADLERDIQRRDKEIKGLARLMRNGNEQATNTPRSLTTPELEKERSDDSSTHSMRLATPSSSIRLPLYRRPNTDDSGAESYATSGAESIDKGSGTSGAESWEVSSKPRRAMRKLKLVENFNNTLSQPLALRQAIEMHKPSTPSIYSTSSSGSSPFSSPTSVTFTSAGLTSIPETPPRPRTISGISLRSVYTQKEQNKVERERKLSNVSNASSGTSSAPSLPTKKSNTTSSRLTPSEAYAKNLRKDKDRPPSIAQILNSGNQNTPTVPIMQESFGGRSRALLGLVPHKKS